MRARLGSRGVIARVSLQRFRLRLRAPLATAHGVITDRAGVLLALEDHAGTRGYGEAMPLAGWPGGTLAEVEAWLASRASELLGKRAHEALARTLVGPPLARAALETALLDLAARARGVPLAATLAMRTPEPAVPVNGLIAAEAPLAVARAARALAGEGFRCFKLKVGTRPLAEDIARVAALRTAIGSGAALRLDANGAWSEEEAVAALAAVAAYAPEYVEEPAAGALACARVRARSAVPIALDESACDDAALELALKLAAADVLVIKPALLGGPRAARAAALRARDAGIDVVVTSFLDSAIGVAAALHCAATLVPNDRACGLASGALFERDLAALRIENGALRLPPEHGLGLAPEPSALVACAEGPSWEARA
ncbi:MAG TPA: o-succinylbenzoate synthase [Myxococcota bacterium]|nr:o-succinylbenzoate synthase [Myxococcota bacterium]